MAFSFGVKRMNFYKTSKWITKREKILRRDSYECRQCKRYGKTTTATSVHHIYPYEERPDLKLASLNLISVCGTCHNTFHDRITNELTAKGIEWVERVGKL